MLVPRSPCFRNRVLAACRIASRFPSLPFIETLIVRIERISYVPFNSRREIMADRVLLTGISGFLGGHMGLELLKQGFEVRGSVRDMKKADKVRATLSKAGGDLSRL